ncbi:MAG: SpoIIE family protein phosphatase [Eubacteriales bacterium]|nr:SpoIIE family protein phosphatase [Eubacteriales bacterium]
MRDIFRSWLFVLILAAFLFTFALTYFTQHKQVEFQTNKKLVGELSYFTEQIEDFDQRREKLRQASDEVLLSKAKLMALAIGHDATLLSDNWTMRTLLDVLDLDAVYITDSTGMIRFSIPHEYEGRFNFSDYKTTSPYMALITRTLSSIVEDPRPNDADAATGVIRYQQYAGVPREDEPGIVQVAYSNAQYDSAIAAISLENCATGYTVGTNGFLVLLNQNKPISATTAELLASPPEYNASAVDKGSFSILYDGARYMARACSSGSMTVLAAIPYSEMYEDIWKVLLWITAFYGITFLSVFLQVSRLLDRVVINNIQKTNKSLKRITSGDLNERISVTDNQEFQELSGGINATVDALKHFIAQAEDRIRAELALAHAIQSSALPSVFPPFPERREFDLHASMKPAKEVGGDFYDFFLIDEDHLALVIADVSGKGIPAALFMMKSKTLIKELAESGLSPAEVMRQANRKLCEGNDAEMFVTAWLGLFTISEGRMVCSNAGHEYPAIDRAGKGWELLHDRHGLVLAAMEQARYTEYELTFAPGDRLFVYTDGVPEATNAQSQLYGTERMLAALEKAHGMNVEDTLRTLHEDINSFVGDAPQFDDITMLIVSLPQKATPSPDTRREQAFVPDEAATEQALAFVRTSFGEMGASRKCLARFGVTMDELFSNIVYYSGATQVTVLCEKKGLDWILTLRDNGTPFDPFTAPVPDVALDVSERPIGGLGLHIVKKTMKSVLYEYKGGENVLTVTYQDEATP